MKKKIFILLILVLSFVFVLTACDVNNTDGNNTKTENSEQYKIYLMATDSGYSGTYEQWLESIRGADGIDGKEIELSIVDKNIVWRYIGATEWKKIYSVNDLIGPKGDKGDTGDDGEVGPQGEQGVSIIDSEINADGYLIITYSNGKTSNAGKVKGDKGNTGVSIANMTFNPLGELVVSYTDGSFDNLGVLKTSGGQTIVPSDPCKHETSDWIIDIQSSCTEQGKRHKDCSVCHYRIEETIPMIEHNYVQVHDKDRHWEECEMCGNIKSPRQHNYQGSNVCTDCGYIDDSVFDYALNKDNTYDIISYNNKFTNIIIPSRIDGVAVTGINGAFEGCRLNSVIIPDSITIIGVSAFSRCGGLQSIIIPNSVISIEDSAFSGCSSLQSIIIPNSVTNIEDSAFSGCSNLQSIIIPSGIESINCNTFSGCTRLTNITFAENSKCKTIGEAAFSQCVGLERIVIPNGVISIDYKAFDGCVGLKDPVIPSSVTNIGDCAFRRCGSLQSVIIPNGVTSIGNSAFWGCTGLESIVIPSSVTSIGKDVFMQCYNLTIYAEVDLAPIGWNQEWNSSNISVVWSTKDFNSNNDYKYVVLKDNTISIVKYIGVSTDINIPSTIEDKYVTKIEDRAFSQSNLANVVIPSSILNIGCLAFWGCTGLESIVIPSGVTSIGDDAFRDCTGLTNIIFEENSQCENIGDYVFLNCTGLASITIPSNVISIGDSVFSECTGLTNIMFEENSKCKTIGDAAFSGCTGLASIIIPDSLISIGDYAFSECTGIASIIIPSGVTTMGRDVFNRCNNLIICSVVESEPRGWDYSWDYKIKSVVWGAKGYGVDVDYKYALLNDDTISLVSYIGSSTEATIPNTINGKTVSQIESNAFANNSGLTSIIIPNNITKIKTNAFIGCSSLSILTEVMEQPVGWDNNWNADRPVGWGVKSVDRTEEFEYEVLIDDSIRIKKCLINKNEIIVPDKIAGLKITRIDKDAFASNTSFTSITIPSTITHIGADAFYGCSALDKVNITGIAAWCDIDFANVYSNPMYYANNLHLNGVVIDDLVIPDIVTNIKDYAFYGCENIYNITIPTSVTTIGQYAFDGCSKLHIYAGAISELEGWAKNSSSSHSWNPNNRPVTWNIKQYTKNAEYKYLIDNDNSITLLDYIGGASSVIVPSQIDGIKVTCIGDYAFSDIWNLGNVTISSGITKIGDNAFYDARYLQSVIIPLSVTNIGEYAFRNCPKLTINAEHVLRPNGWNTYWNPDDRPVNWKYQIV